MSTVKKEAHIHEFERSRTKKHIYRCIHPKCSYYNNKTWLDGKAALCHKCKNEFNLDWQQLKNKYPVCEFCSRSRKATELKIARDIALAQLNLTEDQEDLFNITLE